VQRAVIGTDKDCGECSSRVKGDSLGRDF